jgi:hypothetical protein
MISDIRYYGYPYSWYYPVDTRAVANPMPRMDYRVKTHNGYPQIISVNNPGYADLFLRNWDTSVPPEKLRKANKEVVKR